MKKNILFLFMAGLIVLVGFGSFVAGKGNALKLADEAKAVEPSEYIGYAEYAGMYMLKEILPYEIYKECVRPHVQKLLSKDNITQQEYAYFEQQINNSLKRRGYSIRQCLATIMCEESFSDSFQKNINQFNKDASKMGNDIKKGFNTLMDDIGKQFEKDEPKPKQPKSTEL